MNVLPESLADILKRVRRHQPVVHAITNWVTAADVANALHALGARPVLAVAPQEVEDIVSQADALVLNLGTPTSDRVEAMLLAGSHANKMRKPVVFDPVGAGASEFRKKICQRIFSELRLSVIKGNRAEIGALAGKGGQLRGIDAVSGPEDLRQAARTLSERTGAVIAVSGEHDLVVVDEEAMTVQNGHPLLSRVTGTGCMLAAAVAAFAAVHEDPFPATVAALAFFGLAGERSGAQAAGPGTFKAAFFDALSCLTPEEMVKGMRLGR